MKNWMETNMVGAGLVLAVLSVVVLLGAAALDDAPTPPQGAMMCWRADGGFACEDGTWTPPRIEEDDPAWNCATMGNRQCGPTTGQTLDPCPANMTPGECAAKD